MPSKHTELAAENLIRKARVWRQLKTLFVSLETRELKEAIDAFEFCKLVDCSPDYFNAMQENGWLCVCGNFVKKRYQCKIARDALTAPETKGDVGG